MLTVSTDPVVNGGKVRPPRLREPPMRALYMPLTPRLLPYTMSLGAAFCARESAHFSQ